MVSGNKPLILHTEEGNPQWLLRDHSHSQGLSIPPSLLSALDPVRPTQSHSVQDYHTQTSQ